MNSLYLFERNGERLTARQVAYVLEKYAERQGVGTKSTHKIRKTYASMLNAYGVPIDAIREQLGHSELSTTLSYIYNPLTEDATYSMIANALDGKKTSDLNVIQSDSKFTNRQNSGNAVFISISAIFKRARDGTRTRDPDLGKVVLHQLSHSRLCVAVSLTQELYYQRPNGLSTVFLNFFVFCLHADYILLVVKRDLHHIVRLTAQNLAQFIECFHRDIFIVPDIAHRVAADIVVIDQTVCRDAALFHRPPE